MYARIYTYAYIYIYCTWGEVVRHGFHGSCDSEACARIVGLCASIFKHAYFETIVVFSWREVFVNRQRRFLRRPGSRLAILKALRKSIDISMYEKACTLIVSIGATIFLSKPITARFLLEVFQKPVSPHVGIVAGGSREEDCVVLLCSAAGRNACRVCTTRYCNTDKQKLYD